MDRINIRHEAMPRPRFARAYGQCALRVPDTFFRYNGSAWPFSKGAQPPRFRDVLYQASVWIEAHDLTSRELMRLTVGAWPCCLMRNGSVA